MAAVTNVRVALRCRPLSKKELGEGDTSCFTKEGSSARLKDGEDEVEFAFDYVYDEESTQAEVFRDVGLPVIDAAFAGFNSTVFTYGQTGSGKSWSMTGLIHNPEQRGLLPRINDAIFDRMGAIFETLGIRAETTEHADRRFLVQCSYFEIYNEIIFDLLDPTPRKEKEKAGGLAIKEHPVLGIHVKGLQQIVAPDAPKIMELMDIGSSNRTVASTAMNAESSRSHSVCLLTVHQKDAMDESKNVYSKLNLVDLAGSERADRTGATGSRLKEGANINKSLSTLGSVINGLVEKARGKKGVFIPYRDSKLTRVLQESLGGNALCTMLATLSPAKANAKETISTLRYAARAKTIKITATKNEEASQISQLNDEIAKLKKLLESKADEISQVGVVESREVSGMDVESLKVAEAKVAKQIFEIEKLRSSTWQDKLKESERHETEVAKMKKAHKDAARRAEGERRRRFDLLRQKQDVELSVKELGLPLKWADAARALRALEARLSDRRSHVGVFCDALAADMRAVLPSSEGEGDRDAAAEAIVKRGAADAVESRLGLLSSELAKISRDEESLQTMANDLVGLVQADYDSAEPEDTPKDERRRKEDARKKDRVKLVLEQCTMRRSGFRRAADAARARLVQRGASRNSVGSTGGGTLGRGESSRLAETDDLSAMALQLGDVLRDNARGDAAMAGCADKLVEAAATAAAAATAVGGLAELEAVEAELQARVARAGTPDRAGRAAATSASSGECAAAALSGAKPGGSCALGWAAESTDPQGHLTFDLAELSALAAVVLQAGAVPRPAAVGPPADSAADFGGVSADPDATVEALGSVISWAALRLKPDKAATLLKRPPVRFLQDVFGALDAAAGSGWLGPEAPSLSQVAAQVAAAHADTADAKEARRAYFEAVLETCAAASGLAKAGMAWKKTDGGITVTLKGFEATAETIVAGAGVEGTNALLQILALAAAAHRSSSQPPKPASAYVTSRPLEVILEAKDEGKWAAVATAAVDAQGRCAVASTAAHASYRLRVTKWTFEDDKATPISGGSVGACRAALEIRERAPAAQPEGAMSAADLASKAQVASAKLSKETSTLEGAMRQGAAAFAGAMRASAADAARAQREASEAERGRAEGLILEVTALGDARARAEASGAAALQRLDEANVVTAELKAALMALEDRCAAAETRLSASEARGDAEAQKSSRLSGESDRLEAQVSELQAGARESEEKLAQASAVLDEERYVLESEQQKVSDVTAELKVANESAKAVAATAQKDAEALQLSAQRTADLERQVRDAESWKQDSIRHTAETNARLEAQTEANQSVSETEAASLRASLEASRQSAETCISALTSKCSSLTADVAGLQGALGAKTTQADDLASQLNTAKSSADDLVVAKVAADASASTQQRELSAAKRSLEAGQAEAKRAAEAFEEQAKLLKAARGDVEAQRGGSTVAQAALEAAEARNADLRQRFTDGEAARAEAVRGAEAAQRLAGEADQRADESDRTAQKLKGDCQRLGEAAALEAAKVAAAERAQLALENRTLTLQADCEALEAQLVQAEKDSAAKSAAVASAEADVAEARREAGDLQKDCEEAELALSVAQEERDSAREKEEILTSHVEASQEERDIGAEAYVRLTDQLADMRDDLADTQDRLETYQSRERTRLEEDLGATSEKSAEMQRLSRDAEAVRQGVRKIHAQLKAHLLRKEDLPMDLQGPLSDETADTVDAHLLIGAVGKLVSAALAQPAPLRPPQRALPVAAKASPLSSRPLSSSPQKAARPAAPEAPPPPKRRPPQPDEADDYDDDFE